MHMENYKCSRRDQNADKETKTNRKAEGEREEEKK